MSFPKIATSQAGGLALNSAANNNDDFESAANVSLAAACLSPHSDGAHGLAAGNATEALSAPHQAVADTATTEPSFLGELHNARIRMEVADGLGANDALGYRGMLHVLDAAAVGGMTASKFGTLETLVSLMNAPDGISTSAYVAHISHSLIDGDPANADWTGGEATPVALGNLSATSTRAHVDGLIDKWFLGTDQPSIDSTGKIEATYELQKGPLFSAHEPSYHDVNQGALGDCWFLASIGEVALQDPSAIRSMITNNHNGTFGVRFFVDGAANYVTVNKELPIVDDRSEWSNGSSLVFANGAKGQPLWAELVEKAFAQLNAEPDAVHGGNGGALNAYEGISGGEPDVAVAEITDKDSIEYTADRLVSDAARIGAAFDSGDEVELTTGNSSRAYNKHLWGDHAYEIIGYDASDDEFTIHNPWGSAQSKQMTFIVSAEKLADAGCSMYVSQSFASAEHAAPHAEVEASIASHLAAIHAAAHL